MSRRGKNTGFSLFESELMYGSKNILRSKAGLSLGQVRDLQFFIKTRSCIEYPELQSEGGNFTEYVFNSLQQHYWETKSRKIIFIPDQETIDVLLSSVANLKEFSIDSLPFSSFSIAFPKNAKIGGKKAIPLLFSNVDGLKLAANLKNRINLRISESEACRNLILDYSEYIENQTQHSPIDYVDYVGENYSKNIISFNTSYMSNPRIGLQSSYLTQDALSEMLSSAGSKLFTKDKVQGDIDINEKLNIQERAEIISLYYQLMIALSLYLQAKPEFLRDGLPKGVTIPTSEGPRALLKKNTYSFTSMKKYKQSKATYVAPFLRTLYDSKFYKKPEWIGMPPGSRVILIDGFLKGGDFDCSTLEIQKDSSFVKLTKKRRDKLKKILCPVNNNVEISL